MSIGLVFEIKDINLFDYIWQTKLV